jgi:uncharacterized protein YndB with AHSA1/START domain
MIDSPSSLLHRLDRTVRIEARRETVFRFFTDSTRWALWWGSGSTIDPRPGGRVVIRFPGGVDVHGEVLEIAPPERLVFTYGYAGGTPIAAGASEVSISLAEEGGATRLRLVHAFADPGVRDEHVQGWRYQLALFANVVSDETCAGAAASVDAFFAAWSITDDAARAASLARVAAADVRFRDRFSSVESRDELSKHIGGYQRFMPGLTLQRDGALSQCQGTALVKWIARAADGQERGRGTNVFVFDPDGRMTSVTGFWNLEAG